MRPSRCTKLKKPRRNFRGNFPCFALKATAARANSMSPLIRVHSLWSKDCAQCVRVRAAEISTGSTEASWDDVMSGLSVTIMAREYLFSSLIDSPGLLWTYPVPPVPSRPLLRLFTALLLYVSRLVSWPSFHTVDILNAPFHPYCMYHNTLDSLPIRLVVDRPLWTSPVYIRRPPLGSWALSLT